MVEKTRTRTKSTTTWPPSSSSKGPLLSYEQEDKEELLSSVDDLWVDRGAGKAKLVRGLDGQVCVEFHFVTHADGGFYVKAFHRSVSCLQCGGDDSCWVWKATDWTDVKPKRTHFALRLVTGELASQFGVAFEDVKALNAVFLTLEEELRRVEIRA